jgi:L,D-transpeptidase ErfK/SrfK
MAQTSHFHVREVYANLTKFGISMVFKLFAKIIGSFLFCFIFLSSEVTALTLALPSDGEGDVVGSIQEATAKGDETLADIGRRYDIGSHEMAVANPALLLNKKLFTGTKVVVPSKFILPKEVRKGIVINLAELRLYYYPEERGVVVTQPVGIGREGNWRTPQGKTKVTAKVEDPYWRPTANVRAEAAKHGTPIPYVFPPGPNNPLGKYILRLGWPTYLIHGTNRPEGVGDRVSAGCIRMLPEDAKELYDTVPIGTQVVVINEPYKAGWKGNQLYFEAHPPLQENKDQYVADKSRVVKTIEDSLEDVEAMVRWKKAIVMVKKHTGIPEMIGGK